MIEVYRKHHPACEAVVQRIEAMDRVIVQAQRSVVYRFCGLTEDEIAVVEGRETSANQKSR